MNHVAENASPVKSQRGRAIEDHPAADSDFETILGVRFFNRGVTEAIEHLVSHGGLLAIPAAPALSKLQYDESYRRALLNMDLALLDSGLVATAWKILTGRAITNVSGLRYLECLLQHKSLHDESKVLWLVSSDPAAEGARDQLAQRGYDIREHFFDIVPGSTGSEDHRLLLRIEESRPRHIIIATGGGMQEQLGLYLRDFLLYRPCIHCVGAALAFLTGLERPIPEWAGAARIGWLFRLISQPRMIIPRIGIAFGLLRMLIRHRNELPPLRTRWADV